MINTLRLTHLIYLIYLNKLDVLDVKCLSFNIELRHIGMSSIKFLMILTQIGLRSWWTRAN